ncbi:hypothetical protein CAEBREN_30245 [Caenorhabditis brenneri]|uniref:Uncharacterized protein n=1 Tax=Caenorhabditis brenneri TaxID=135651 RepID=G0NPR4_CAEBE|nr:hypothetical protein CAEBREN_30245 [Caenorhabditis brenneri]
MKNDPRREPYAHTNMRSFLSTYVTAPDGGHGLLHNAYEKHIKEPVRHRSTSIKRSSLLLISSCNPSRKLTFFVEFHFISYF